MKNKLSKLKYFYRALCLSISLKSKISMFIGIIGFGAAFLPTAISKSLASFTDNVQILALSNGYLSKTLASFAFLAFLYVLKTIFTMAQNYYVGEDVSRIKRYIKEQVLEVTSDVPYKNIENYDNFIEKVEFVKQYAGKKAAGSISLIFGWISSSISFVSLVIILGNVNWWLVLLLIATCIPAVILANLQKDEDYRQRTKWMKEGTITIHYADICRGNEAMKDIRFFGLFDFFKRKWRKSADIYINEKSRVTKKHVFYNSIADFLRNGVYLFVLLITAYEIYAKLEVGLGVFMLVITAASQLQEITTRLLTDMVSILADEKYMADFFDLIDIEKENIDENVIPFESLNIELCNVKFMYPNSENFALDGINLSINQGEKIAIVGANGSGKSTFVNLICGLYEPTEGLIKVNGNILSNNLSKVRRSLSVIFQTFCHYHDTLRNNIIVSSPNNIKNDAQIMELAKQTGVDEIIGDNHAGLDEMIGAFSKDGVNLSGGQWQKVAITRALYRDDACAYILDEPTAALDPIAEANIYRNFNTLTGDKTTLLISHRLGITSVVGRILVFDKGKIVEDGSHEELIKKDGTYAKLYKAQARWYQ